MSPADHNKVIGVLHLVYGGISVLMMIVVSLFVVMFGLLGSAQPRDDVPSALLITIVMSFMLLFYIVFAVPSLLAGYALLKQKKWAKVMATVAAIVAAMSFPFGTALCIYTLWFLFGDKGRALYDKRSYALLPPPPLWARASTQQREPAYVPPTSPPDWR